MEVIQLNQVQIESVSHVIGKAPKGCFSNLWQDMQGLCKTNYSLPKHAGTFLTMCNNNCIGHDASYNKISTELTITTMSFVILNNMLCFAGYDQIDEDDEDDRGLRLNITIK